MSVRCKIKHGGWMWDVDTRCHAHPRPIVPEVAWADEQRETGLSEGIRDEVACRWRHGSVDRIHAREDGWQKVL